MSEQLVINRWECRRFKVFKFCIYCDRKFYPLSKYGKVCPYCVEKNRYKKLKN